MDPRIPLLPPMFPISRQSLWNLPANMPLILLEPIDPPHSKLTFSWLHSHYLLHLTPSLGILLCPPLISCPCLIPRTPSYLFCCLLQVRGLFHLLSFLPPINLLFAIDCIPLLEWLAPDCELQAGLGRGFFPLGAKKPLQPRSHFEKGKNEEWAKKGQEVNG